LLFSRVAVPFSTRESCLGFNLLLEELLKDFTPFPTFQNLGHSNSLLHLRSSVAGCAVSQGVAGEVSYNTILSYFFRGGSFHPFGRLEKVVHEKIPPYFALGQPHSIICSAVPILDNIIQREYLL